MEYKIVFGSERVIRKDFEKIPRPEQIKILDELENLDHTWPKSVQVKKLVNSPVADYRLRIGNYRVLFSLSMESGAITVFRVLHRSSAYKS